VTHPAVQDLKLNCSYGLFIVWNWSGLTYGTLGSITSMLRSYTTRKKAATAHPQSIELNHCDRH